MIEFGTPPEIGTVLKLDDQSYELRDVLPHTRVDGRASVLLVWESTCPTCGEAFAATTGLAAKSVNRRCRLCVRPDKPVKGRRGRKVVVQVTAP